MDEFFNAIGDFFKHLLGLPVSAETKATASVPVITTPTVNQPTAQPQTLPVIPLSWETNHPERRAWSVALCQEIDAHYDAFLQATDLDKVRSDWETLPRAQRVTALAEMMVWIAYYESSWNPAAQDDHDAHGETSYEQLPVGLFQMNAADDQRNYHTGTTFTEDQLKDPFNNIKVGVAIFNYVTPIRKKLAIPAGESSKVISVFFATLHPGGIYDSSAKIFAKTQAMKLQATIPGNGATVVVPVKPVDPKPPEMTPVSPGTAWTVPSFLVKTPRNLQKQLEQMIDVELLRTSAAGLQAACLAKDANKLVALCSEALSSLKVREKTNSNDGLMVELIQKTCYGSRGEAWCMYGFQTGVAYAEKKTGLVSKIIASGECAQVRSDTKARHPEMIIPYQQAQRGDAFIWKHLSGLGHVGTFSAWIKEFTAATLNECNTTAGKLGDKIVREGGGAYTTERDITTSTSSDMSLAMVVRAF